MTHFNLTTFLKRPYLHTQSHFKGLGAKASIYEFGET